MTCERGQSSQEFACRRWLKEIAPTRTHGIVTGLPREETIRPPDSPGFRSWVILPNGDTLHTNDIFCVRLPPSYVKLRYVFRRARIESDEVTAWGPIGSDNDGWRILGIQRCKERVS